MGRPDWRAMLAGMTSTEYADWHRFYRTHYFQDTQLDMHFSGLTYAVLSLFFCDPDMHPSDFSLLVPRHEEEQVERPDEDKMLSRKRQDLPEASGSVGTEGAIFYRLRMWRMSWWMMPH